MYFCFYRDTCKSVSYQFWCHRICFSDITGSIWLKTSALSFATEKLRSGSVIPHTFGSSFRGRLATATPTCRIRDQTQRRRIRNRLRNSHMFCLEDNLCFASVPLVVRWYPFDINSNTTRHSEIAAPDWYAPPFWL